MLYVFHPLRSYLRFTDRKEHAERFDVVPMHQLGVQQQHPTSVVLACIAPAVAAMSTTGATGASTAICITVAIAAADATTTISSFGGAVARWPDHAHIRRHEGLQLCDTDGSPVGG